MVNSSRPNWTLWVTRSARTSRLNGLAQITAPAPTKSTRPMPTAISTLLRLLIRRALGSRDGFRLGPLAVTSAPAISLAWVAGVGTSTGGAAGALTGCDVIDPHSSIVQGH